MSWSKSSKKPKKKLSYEEQLDVKRRLEATKALRKTLRGYAVLERAGSQQDVKVSGAFKDEDELRQVAASFASTLAEVSGKPWKVADIQVLNSSPVYENEEEE